MITTNFVKFFRRLVKINWRFDVTNKIPTIYLPKLAALLSLRDQFICSLFLSLDFYYVPVASFEGKKVTEWSFFDIKRNDDGYVYFMSFEIKNQL